MGARRRLDTELVRRGLAESRERAQADIAAGRVTVGGAPATKASRMVDASEAVLVHGPPPKFVSRAGAKLEGAVEHFALHDIVAGARVLDAGASTGGFTDCVLQYGASEVVAVDVGHNQLHEKLEGDPRVHSIERTNLRTVDPALLGPVVDGARHPGRSRDPWGGLRPAREAAVRGWSHRSEQGQRHHR